MKRRNLLLGLTGAGLATALPARAQFNTRDRIWDGGGSSDPADDEEEIQAGQVLLQMWVRRDGGPYPDNRIQDALQRFVRPLTLVSERPHLPWSAVLVNNREFNACAWPGGAIEVNIGLIEACETQGEFASVLAHEIGHVDRAHWRKDYDMGRLLGAAGFGAGGFIPDSRGVMSAAQRASLERTLLPMMQLSYGRQDESEADDHIQIIFDRLGLDIREAASMFVKMAKDQNYFSFEPIKGDVHLASMERARRAQELVAFSEPRRQQPKLPGWDELHARFPTLPKFVTSGPT